MKKSVIYLGLALVTFGNVAMASNEVSTAKNPVELVEYAANPLNVAISKGDIVAVQKFIEYGADVNLMSEELTPLMTAARYNKYEIIKVLLANGAKPSTKNESGFTALRYAELSNASESIALLKDLK
ncbi:MULTISPECIES: ankyrin repeat domain-containing protein [Flavobacterium]|uniref:Ankyrin repeat domain-containing protein n=1 Tax=Flavobacterium ginsengisoli TaxID=871694 RepID=A0ABP7FJW5_9FLAO|nr:ankyrin repeat domain-containing protein [Flavobacterium sp. IB48]MBJ2126866.1 ankyrin repeat domain-containing protein [Flavobacterium sp. IB48]